MGPLAGITVIEVGGIGPAPFCGMLLADLGANVIVIERRDPGGSGAPASVGFDEQRDILRRGKKSVALDLKAEGAAAALLRLVSSADALLEGFRPGVTERLGIGPAQCSAANPALVYGRVTGWGQDGPLAGAPGHDINYIALAGALFHGGARDRPPAAPPTLVGDVGGGAMLLAVGVLAALLHARLTGEGQVVDAAISDGSALLTTLLVSLQQQSLWTDERQANLLDGGAPWYGCYECADGAFVAVGALEPAFYRELLRRLGLDADPEFERQYDTARWPGQRARLAEVFRSRSRDAWCRLLEGSDACVAPVLSLSEAREHPHNVARGTFAAIGGVAQPAPAPRFGRTPLSRPDRPPRHGEHTATVLRGAGLSDREIDLLRSKEAI